MKYIFLIFPAFLSIQAFSQIHPVEPIQNNLDIMKQEGQLVTIKISKGSPIKIFVIGKEQASFDPLKMKLTVRRLAQGTAKDLSIKKVDDYYSVSDPVGAEDHLEVTTKLQGKTETFKFKMSPSKP